MASPNAPPVQIFDPAKNICAHLNAFHVYASEPTRFVEADHFCSHVNKDIRQCLLYDSPHRGARLIGVEYMVTPEVFATITDPAERRLWHSHVFEVKSGLLVMPQPRPEGGGDFAQAAAQWERAETAEMANVIQLYGKAYHLWQVDRGDALPLGAPELVTSFTAGAPEMEAAIKDRDARFGVDWLHKRELRKDIPEPEIASDVDSTWKKT